MNVPIILRSRCVAGLIAMGGVLVAAAPAAAAPGDYVIRYDWGDPAAGFTGWGDLEVPAVGTPGYASPFYAARLARPKLRIATSPAADGTADRVYPAIDGTFGPHRTALVQAPGTTQIRSARFDAVDSLRATGERQFLRLAVYGDSPPSVDNAYDFRPDTPPSPGAPGLYQNDVLYSDVGPITVDPAEPGRTAQVWLLTSCDPSCPTVGFGPGGTPRSYGQVGSVRLDLFDPEAPALTASGPLTAGEWTNAREPRDASITATDPGSGLRSVRAVRRRQSGFFVQVLDAQADCDEDHVRGQGAGREAAACPDRLDTSLSQSLGGLPDGEYSYSVTATDDSARTTTSSFALRLDRTRPGTVSGSGPLRALAGRWTNRTDRASLVVRGRDGRSGIRRLELLAEAGGVERVVAGADSECASGCPRAFAARLLSDLNRLPDGRVALTVRAIDAAGNATDRRLGTLLLDRVAPPVPIVAVRSSAGATVLTIKPQADPAPGSGVVGFVAGYRRTLNGPVRTVRIAAAGGEGEARGRGTRARIASRLEGDIAVRSVDRAGNVGGAFAAGGPFSRRCVPELGKAFIKPAKIGEVRAGTDTEGKLTYGEDGGKSLELVGGLTVKGVSISFSDSYEHSDGFMVPKKADPGEGFNVSVRLILKPERLRLYVNGRPKKPKSYCERTAGAKRVYEVVETAAVPIAATPMPAWQRGRADCNNRTRWANSRLIMAHRVIMAPNTGYTKNENRKVTFARGLSVLGVGFTTRNTYGHSSTVGYTFGKKYRGYWICGDGGTPDATGAADPKTWSNLFAGADLSSGRVR